MYSELRRLGAASVSAPARALDNWSASGCMLCTLAGSLAPTTPKLFCAGRHLRLHRGDQLKDAPTGRYGYEDRGRERLTPSPTPIQVQLCLAQHNWTRL